ncbi:MAG: formate dehydrogenase accessory protein FdhE [Desulfurococcales archaeon]|nr:formate dehydrogenase accessory protein FdhE [Desulfurococcales archaeon]
MTSIEEYAETLHKVAKRYNIDIEEEFAISIERVQMEVRRKVREYLTAKGYKVDKDKVVEIARKVYDKIGFHTEFDEIRSILLTRGIDDEKYIEVLIGQAILHELTSLLPDKDKGIVNKTAKCPICGTETDLGYIDTEGNIWLYCPLCGYTWKQSTLSAPVCPYCGLSDKNMIGVLKDKRNPSVVVMLCSNCKHYWILVDERYTKRVPRDFYPMFRRKAEKLLASLPKDFIEAGQ